MDGESLRDPRPVHLLFYKPRGVICTSYERETKPRVIDFFTNIDARLFPVGRLDEDSEGLILVTNDGMFANAVAHPRRGIPKVYEVLVDGRMRLEDVERIGQGIWLAEGKTHVDSVRILRRGPKSTLLRFTLAEGKNREIRRILARLGYRTRRLRRIAIGPLGIGNLAPGRHRKLRPDEVRRLLEPPGSPPPPRKTRTARREVQGPAARRRSSPGSRAGRPDRPRAPSKPRGRRITGE